MTDRQWARLQALLPQRRPGPRSTLGDRLFIDAVLYRAKTGVAWRDLPEHFGPWKTVYNRFSNWAERGLVERNALGRSRGGFSTKLHAVVDRQGRPLRVAVTPGQQHEATIAEQLIEHAQGNALMADTAYDYRVEVFFHSLKRFRAIATRYDKTARNYLALVQLACTWLWLGTSA
jgi:transposase